MATLPSLPFGTTTELTLSSNANILESAFGGPAQRNAKMGDKWTLEVACRPMRADQAEAVIVPLLLGLSEKLIAEVPQPGKDIGNPGNPTISGAGQSGRNVAMTGFTPGYVIRVGQFFSILTGGVRYLHKVTAEVTANGSGSVVVPMIPMLKVSPANGAVCEFAHPKIEGFPDGNKQSWTTGLARNVGVTFMIKEAQ